jgi:hypothetical protein
MSPNVLRPFRYGQEPLLRESFAETSFEVSLETACKRFFADCNIRP